MKSLKLLAISFLLYLFKIFINVCVIVNKFDTWCGILNMKYKYFIGFYRLIWLGRVAGIELSLTRFNVLKTLHIYPLNDCHLLLILNNQLLK